jgi:hypothetical protein
MDEEQSDYVCGSDFTVLLERLKQSCKKNSLIRNILLMRADTESKKLTGLEFLGERILNKFFDMFRPEWEEIEDIAIPEKFICPHFIRLSLKPKFQPEMMRLLI